MLYFFQSRFQFDVEQRNVKKYGMEMSFSYFPSGENHISCMNTRKLFCWNHMILIEKFVHTFDKPNHPEIATEKITVKNKKNIEMRLKIKFFKIYHVKYMLLVLK